MKYNIKALAKKTGFGERVIEKVCRMSDVLYELSVQEFISKRLSLYGGSALNFIHFKSVPRLSVDLDFNYRQVGNEDWGKAREEIDDRLKKILRSLGYTDIAIQAKYPLSRMEISYKNVQNLKDTFKIEIGYMRRIPLLSKDVSDNFFHIGREERFSVLTPQKEELFSNKFCTMLSRGNGRDLFDVHQITELEMDADIFRKCVVIESLMHVEQKLYEMDTDSIINSIQMDDRLMNLLRKRKIPPDITSKVAKFAVKNIRQLSLNEKELINNFYDKKNLHA